MAITVTAPKPVTRIKGYDTRKLRQAAGLTQQQVADLSGVPRTHVALLEKQYPVPLDSKRRILSILWAKKTGK